MTVLAVVAATAFVQAFGGTWACQAPTIAVAHPPPTRWTIRAVPNSAWTEVRWEPRGGGGGVGFLGPVPLENQWIYVDFHADGSFTQYTSPGPSGNVWIWSGTSTTPERIAHFAVRWERTGDTLHRSFGRLLGTSFRTSASDACRMVTSARR